MGKMNATIAMQRQLKKAMALLGDAAPKIEITAATVKEARATKPNPFYEAEAVLLFLEKPARFMQKQCKRTECGEWFGTNYRAVGYCSDNCRIKSLSAMGIQWDPSKRPEERWGGEEPLVIPPAALKMLIQLAQKQAEVSFSYPPLGTQDNNWRLVRSEQQCMDLLNGRAVVPETIVQKEPQSPEIHFVLQEVDFDAGF